MHDTLSKFSCAVITLSDKGAAGLRTDTSGTSVQEILEEQGYDVIHYSLLPDNENRIVEELVSCADIKKIDLIITTGGTGVSPSDTTPEATKRVIEKEIPGIAETMRAESMKKTHHAMLSRGIAGIRGQSLIINLPGSRKGAIENLTSVIKALPHAIKKIQGDPADCAPP